MNAGVAKPIRWYLVYSQAIIDPAHTRRSADLVGTLREKPSPSKTRPRVANFVNLPP
jgi:hypothetical protein